MTRASAALSATIHEAMHTDEARVIEAWRQPPKPSAWQQAVEEISHAGACTQVAIALLYGFALVVTIAIVMAGVKA
jgi:hypothetical protein